MADPRLSEILRQAASSFTMPPRYVEAVERAARLAELVADYQAAQNLLDGQYGPGDYQRANLAIRNLRAFDLSGGSR